MVATVAGIHLGVDTHANRPAGNTVPDGSLYSCSTHSLVYKSNFAGNSWATWATLGSGGIAASLADDAGDTLVASAADTFIKRKNNPAAAAAPTVGDDSGDGYAIGSRWLDTTNDREYVALDVSVGAAIWRQTTPGAWATFSPTFNTQNADGAIGDGTILGRWKRIDASTVAVHIHMVFGATTNPGSGNFQLMNFPFTVKSTVPAIQLLSGVLVDAGTASYVAMARVTQGATMAALVVVADAAGTRHAAAGIPITWAVGDQIILQGILETD